MARKLGCIGTVCLIATLLVAAGGTTQANWLETFNGAQLDLPTWQFTCFPDVTKTYKNTIVTAPDGNKYLSLDETTPYDTDKGKFGSAFGAAFGSPEVFNDVRVGAIVNVVGDDWSDGLDEFHGDDDGR